MAKSPTSREADPLPRWIRPQLTRLVDAAPEGYLGIDRGIVGGCGIPTCHEEDVIELTYGCICRAVADEFCRQ
jgi:hypothetical protein